LEITSYNGDSSFKIYVKETGYVGAISILLLQRRILFLRVLGMAVISLLMWEK